MQQDTGEELDVLDPSKLWRTAFQRDGHTWRPDYQQIVTPYRGEQFGTTELNRVLQDRVTGETIAE